DEELEPEIGRVDDAGDPDERQQAGERRPVVGGDQRHDGDEEHRAEMHHCRADECLHRSAVLLGKDAGTDRGGDEHEADQGRRRRADQEVEIVPSVEVVCERGVHGSLTIAGLSNAETTSVNGGALAARAQPLIFCSVSVFFRRTWSSISLSIESVGVYYGHLTSGTPRGTSAGVAFQARAVANEREVAAFAAGLAFVALGLGFGALLRRQRPRAGARLGNLAARDGELVLLELLGGRGLLLGPRGGAFGARLAAAEGRDLAAAGRAPRATLPADGGG